MNAFWSGQCVAMKMKSTWIDAMTYREIEAQITQIERLFFTQIACEHFDQQWKLKYT